MYAKLFTSIYQGTLRGNSNGILVFTNMLAHCDKHGICDIHPRAIAEEVGLSQEAVRASILELEAPDPESRSPEEEGRRIVRVDEHRAWGWRVVNFLKYRAIRDEDDRREQNRLAQEAWRLRKQSKPASATISPDQPIQKQKQIQKQEAEEEKTLEPTVLVPAAARQERIPPCPTDEIVKAFHEALPMMPAVIVLNASRRAAIAARWREVVTTDKLDQARGIEFFRWFFGNVAKSRFLTGRVTSRDGRTWKADLDWLMKPTNFAKTIEGNYHKDAA